MNEFKIAAGDTRGLEDIESFVQLVNTLDAHPTVEARGLFDLQGDIHVGRAPGRLDVMGGSRTTPALLSCSCRLAKPRLLGCRSRRIPSSAW